MPRPLKRLVPERSGLDWFGAELRYWRTERGMGQRDLAQRVWVSTSLIGRVETAERRCAPDLAKRLDAVLDTGGVLSRALVRVTAETSSGDQDGRVSPASTSQTDAVEWGRPWTDSFSASALEEARLWRGDLDGVESVRAGVPVEALMPLALSWLVNRAETTAAIDASARGALMISTAAKAFAGLDNRFGGAHARRAAVQYLHDAVAPMLHEASDSPAGRAVFSATAEFVLAVAWMAYDGHDHGIARRYFRQALHLTDRAHDRLLGASVLSAMSHQATYLGEYSQGRDLARAALAGAGARASATIRAQFLMMEARAMAAAGEAAACTRAMAAAETAFTRSRPDDDPEWIGYFDACEFTDELAHCHRDLGHADHARFYAEECLALSAGDDYARSRTFSHLVHAAAVLDQKELDEAAHTAVAALPLVEQTTSARAIGYLNDLATRFSPHAGHPAVKEFLRQATPLLQRGGRDRARHRTEECRAGVPGGDSIEVTPKTRSRK